MTVGVCGFCCSGSSAVLDYLKEYGNGPLQVLDDYEFNLPYMPDGLEDLEYHLTKQFSRDDDSYVAINRFRHFIKVFDCGITSSKTSLSSKRLNNITEEFLNSIIQFKWTSGRRSYYALAKNDFWNHYFNTSLMGRRILPFLAKRSSTPVLLGPNNHIVELSINPSNFEEASKKFIRDILIELGADFDKTIILDQPFIGDDPAKSFHFFDDARAIVVDRDPRDVYLFAKKFMYKKGGNKLPVDKVQNFVKYYKLIRENRPYQKPNSKILLMHFEELVYDYDVATKRINSFLGLPSNPNPKTIFSPMVSMPNTQVFRRYPEYSEDMSYIEKELPDYLFDFTKYPVQDVGGKMFMGKSPLNK